MLHSQQLSGNAGYSGKFSGTKSDDDPTGERPAEQIERLRRERDALEAKLDQIAQVIGTRDASKIVHDVRNVMNELVLLRKLAEMDS